MAEKNPYTSDTPEWQLWENMTSSRSLVNTYANDADRYQRLSAQARERADKFEAALNKLSAAR